MGLFAFALPLDFFETLAGQMLGSPCRTSMAVMPQNIFGAYPPGWCAHVVSAAPALESLITSSSSMSVVGIAFLGVLGRRALREKSGMLQGRSKVLIGCAASKTSRAAEVAADASPVSSVDDFDVSRQYGVTPPCGRPGAFIWDPAGLATNIDVDTFRQYRRAELKHGRICMVALMGLIVQAAFKFPQFQEAPSGMGALAPGQNVSPFIGIIALFFGVIEYNTSDEGREPGDYGDPLDIVNSGFSDDLGIPAVDSFEFPVWRDFELNHCRLAMIGFLASVVAEYATGLDVINQWKAAGPAYERTKDMLWFPEQAVAPLQNYM